MTSPVRKQYAAKISNCAAPHRTYREVLPGTGASAGGAAGASAGVSVSAAARLRIVGLPYTSFIDTDGRSSRFLTRAQKCAMTRELAPRSSKKWLSSGTWSRFTTPASTSARIRSVPPPAPAVSPAGCSVVCLVVCSVGSVGGMGANSIGFPPLFPPR